MTDTTTEPQPPEPWSVWGNPYNGFFVWHAPTGKWLPVINDMADAVDPDHPAAQNLHQLSAYHGVACTQPAPTIKAGMTQSEIFRAFDARLTEIMERLDGIGAHLAAINHEGEVFDD